MSRSQTRARRRCARIAGYGAEFARLRHNPLALLGFLKSLSSHDVPIWPVAEAAARCRPLDEAERAMVAQVVAPRLAGMTSGSVRQRLALGRPPISTLRPEGAFDATADAKT